MSASERFSRQERLAEVGVAGQERIRHFAVVVGEGAEADVERAYLVGAGIGLVSTRPEHSGRPFTHAAAFQFESAREIGEGAWRALSELRKALGIGKQ